MYSRIVTATCIRAIPSVFTVAKTVILCLEIIRSPIMLAAPTPLGCLLFLGPIFAERVYQRMGIEEQNDSLLFLLVSLCCFYARSLMIWYFNLMLFVRIPSRIWCIARLHKFKNMLLNIAYSIFLRISPNFTATYLLSAS